MFIPIPTKSISKGKPSGKIGGANPTFANGDAIGIATGKPNGKRFPKKQRL